MQFRNWLQSGRLKSQGLCPGMGKVFSSSPCCSGQFRGPPSLLSIGHPGSFPGIGEGELKQLGQVSRSKIHGSMHPFPHTSSGRSA
jgi:hypothetical protein